MSKAMNWVAGAAVVGALALVVQAANNFDSGPSFEVRDRLLDLKLQASKEQLHVTLLSAAVGNRLLNLEQEVALLRGSSEPLGERIEGVDLSLERGVLLRETEEGWVYGQEAAMRDEQDGETRFQSDIRAAAERLLIKAETALFQERQRVELLEELLIENDIDYTEIVDGDASEARPASRASLFVSSEDAPASTQKATDPATEEARKRALVEREITKTEAQITRMQRIALKMDRLLVENGINPATGLNARPSTPEAQEARSE